MKKFSAVLSVWAMLFFTGALHTDVLAEDNASGKPEGSGQTEVPVRVVMLFSSGVGYFEHSGSVVGNGQTELRFKTGQINDILKSLVLQDLDGGRISRIVYPSQDPAGKTLKSFQVDITDNPSLGNLLNQLRGAKVKVSVHAETWEGIILGLEIKKKQMENSQTTLESWQLNLLSGSDMRSFALDDVQKIELEDAVLQKELNEALKTLAEARDQDKKPVTIFFEGDGKRRVQLGYVVETPIWKTSYRLMMPKDKEKKGKLQGWAIVENQTDSDWNHVELSLVSGRPISFIQDLYQPLYAVRPVVQQEVYASLQPQSYDAGLDYDLAREEAAPAGMGFAMASESASYAGGPQAKTRMAFHAKKEALDPFASVASSANAERVGELFEYNVAGVSLPRQRSAMIPIVADDIEAERISIYNQSVFEKNPLNGAKLKNTSGKHLLAGPLTVFDEGVYAGDAQINDVPPGQERFLSYAVDLNIQVNPEIRKEENHLTTGKIVKGILQLVYKEVSSQTFGFENKSEKAKVVILEYPFRSGWKLVNTAEPAETTDSLYRFRVELTANGKTKFSVQEELLREESFYILPADIGQVEFYSQTGAIPEGVRKALYQAAEGKRKLVDLERQIREKEDQKSRISNEQSRMRSNMQTVDKTSQYYTRLLAKLNDQETEMEKLESEIQQLKENLDKERKSFEEKLSELNAG
jgi:hypothetical protein